MDLRGSVWGPPLLLLKRNPGWGAGLREHAGWEASPTGHVSSAGVPVLRTGAVTLPDAFLYELRQETAG